MPVPEKSMNVSRKLMINIIVVFVICFAALFVYDGFVLHPIPAPSKTFEPTGDFWNVEFQLSETGCIYENANVIYQSEPCAQREYVVLVEQGGEYHLLYFSSHYPTYRMKLADDMIIDPDVIQEVHLGTDLHDAYVKLEKGGKVTYCAINDYTPSRWNITWYVMISLIVTAVETAIFYLIIRPKKKR